MSTTVSTGKTLAQLISENQALTAKVALLESANKLTISVKLAKHGMGALSLSGLQRFPLSLHPAQWPELFTVAPAKIRSFMDLNGDEIRCYAVAAEYAVKTTGLKTAPEKTAPERKGWETQWDMGYTLAKNDKNVVPSSPKYKPASEILAAWK